MLRTKPLIAGNWKMNILPSEAVDLALRSSEGFDEQATELLICPPFTHLQALQAVLSKGISLGAQNCSHRLNGAFTGDISVEMLKDLGCKYAIIGHSERRAYYPQETSFIPQKLQCLNEYGMIPIYCCGEGLDSRNSGRHFDTVAHQLEQDLSSIEDDILKKMVIAYEPVWAIGTGKNASADQAQEMHLYIKKHLKDKRGIHLQSVIYGGSVNAANAAEFAQMPDINGVLVGGASLKPIEFTSIIAAFS